MAVYTLMHKPVPYGYEPGTIPIQVGFGKRFLEVTDETGENIHEWNELYAELTGIYWIWKNDTDDLKGQMQYRRRLPLVKGLGDGFRVRTCKPLNLGRSLWSQYSLYHSESDLLLAERIIAEFQPAYLDDWNRYIKQDSLIYYSEGFLMRREDYDAYCHWLFGFLEIFRHLRHWETPEDSKKTVAEDMIAGRRNSVRGWRYQSQVFGFLAERLFTLYVRHHFEGRIQTDGYRLMENTGI